MVDEAKKGAGLGSQRGPKKSNYTPMSESNVKKKCRFCLEKVVNIDYKDVNTLKRYTTEKGKIMHSRSTGTCAKHQRQLAKAVKRARIMALMPFVGE